MADPLPDPEQSNIPILSHWFLCIFNLFYLRIKVRYSLFNEKVNALRPLMEHLQNRVRTLIGMENDIGCRNELRNAIRQLKKRLDIILELPLEKTPVEERSAINLLRGELIAVNRLIDRSSGKILNNKPQVSILTLISSICWFII